jgi:tetratricopeptide (TPR) repeat protein
MKLSITILAFSSFSSLSLLAQNCNFYLVQGDTCQYEACKIAEPRNIHYQYSREYQEICDEAISRCPEYAPAYSNKSTAYLKSGDFVTWEYLMGKAVDLEPKEYLGYRGWCRYSFFLDYQGAIDDLERLESLIGFETGYSAEGDYHLQVARALCYKGLGNKEKAISILEEYFEKSNGDARLYNFLHLGVLYLETGQIAKAKACMEKQLAVNALAEAHYYMALIHKAENDKKAAKAQLQLAKTQYDAGLRMRHDYTHHMDKIYLVQINALLESDF